MQCGDAPVFLHATLTSGSGGLNRFQDVIGYTCDEGYTLDQTGYPTGPKLFEITCDAQGKFTEERVCLPVSCGPAPQLGHATWKPQQCAPALPDSGLPEYKAGCPSEMDPVVYPYIVPYECEDGYTTNGLGSYQQTQAEFFRSKKLYIACRPSGEMVKAFGAWQKVGAQDGHQVQWASESYEAGLPFCRPVECGLPEQLPQATVPMRV